MKTLNDYKALPWIAYTEERTAEYQFRQALYPHYHYVSDRPLDYGDEPAEFRESVVLRGELIGRFPEYGELAFNGDGPIITEAVTPAVWTAWKPVI